MTTKNHLEIFLELNSKAFKNSLNQIGPDLRKISSGLLSAVQAPARALTGTLAKLTAGLGAVFSAGQFVKIAEEYTGLDARLKLVTASSQELKQVQDDLYQLSQKTGTGYQENAATYTKLAVALKNSGASSKELIGINEAVAKSLVVGGASAAETGSFLLQFGQAMGSGVLQGDEFRSMMESNSYFAQQLAKALDTDVAGLRSMASEGKLTTQVIRNAVPKMLQQINADFDKMPLTIGRAMTMLSNAFGKIVNGSNQAGGATGKIAAVIKDFVSYLDSHGREIEDFIVKIIDMGTQAAKTAWEWKEFIAAFIGTSVVTNILVNLVNAFVQLGGIQIISWGASVVTTLKSIQLAALTTTGALGAAAGATLALAGGYALGKKIAEWEYFSDVVKANKTALAEVPAKFAAISQATGVSIRSFKDLDKAQKDGLIRFNSVSGAWEKVSVSAKKSAADQVNAQKKATDAMKKAYQGYADTVKKLQDDIAGRERSLAEQLRAMDRSGMSEANAWKDRKAEAEEFATSARKAEEAAKAAFAAGNTAGGEQKYKEAVDLYDKAREAAADLNTEIRNGDQVIQTQAESLKIAKSMVEEYGDAGTEAERKYTEAIKQTAAVLDKQSGGTLSKDLPEAAKAFADVAVAAEDLVNKSDDFNKAWKDSWDRAVYGGEEAIKQLEADLQELTKDRHIKVYVSEVSQKATGGIIGALHMATGGAVQTVRNMLSGGFFPGFGGGDRRHVIAEDGEYMLDKFRVKDAGVDVVQAFHAGNYGYVIQELLKKVGGTVSRRVGGIINQIPSIPPLGPQFMQLGGEVQAGFGLGGDVYNLNLNFSGQVSQPSDRTLGNWPPWF